MKVRNLTCPYCNKRTTREKMINHIDYNHSDQLPEGFTPLRMTFHIANNKPIEYRRPCRICGNPTEWDEKKGRYNFLCSNPICKEKYVAKMKTDMGEKYGAYRPTATAEGLEKMLAARRISGKYKWSDGTVFNYTGSYELETLKFMDKGLEIRSEDIMVPGPVLEYEYDGQKHLYITDIYYRPYNLVIEVKDGGSSVNKNKQYAETRAKQMAKEKHVIENTDYNYIRLTDKDMSQLMAVLGDLKYHLVEKDTERVIHVNENTPIANIAPVVGFNPDKDVVIVNYMKKKTFVDDSDYAIADSPKFDTVYSRDTDGILKKSDKSILLGSYYTPYILKGRRESIVEALYNNKDKYVSKNFIYETAFGHPMYSKDQIKYEAVEKYEDYYQGLENIKEIITESYIINEKDIYYNKDKFDSGEINLCFITGHSGSGKSTMGRNLATKEDVETYELDDVVWNKMAFTMENFKEYGDLIYSFFNGPGKKYYYTKEDVKAGLVKEIKNYENDLLHDFVKYSINYASSHKNKKFVLEGIWLIDFFKPEEFKDYAFYIKGTSALISHWRAIKRDSQDAPKEQRFAIRFKNFFNFAMAKENVSFEKDLKKFRDYFKKLESNKEDTMVESKYLVPSDEQFNLDSWTPYSNNILYITGMAGSGKSTTTKDLRESYNCNTVCLDTVSYFYMGQGKVNNGKQYYDQIKESCPGAEEFFDLNPRSKVGDKITHKDTIPVLKEFCNWFEKKFKDDGNLYVIDSFYLPLIHETAFYVDKPVIVKEETLDNIILRRINRTKFGGAVANEKEIALEQNNIRLKNNYQEYIDFSNQLSEFITENADLLDEQHDEKETNMGIYGYTAKAVMEAQNNTVSDKDLERNKKLYPIFVVNTFTGTTDGKMIKAAAGMKYSHALISLSPTLSPMYSFDEAEIPDPKDPSKKTEYKGLVVDNFERYKRDMGFGDLRVIAIMVTSQTKKLIQEAIKYYLDRIDQTKYSYKKLVGFIVGSKEVNSFGDMAMVCSEFVDSILKYAKIDISGKSSSNTKPDDLAKFKDRNNFFQIYEGKVSGYKTEDTEKKIENLRQTIEYKNLKSQTRNSMKNPYDYNLGRENLIPGMAKRAGKAVANKVGKLKKKVLREDGTFEYVDDEEFFNIIE